MSVTLSTGGGSTPAVLATIHRRVWVRLGLPGNSEAVWPSEPIPSNTRSENGRRVARAAGLPAQLVLIRLRDLLRRTQLDRRAVHVRARLALG